MDEDELLARQIGLSDASQMSSTQERYKKRIKEKLLEVSFTVSGRGILHKTASLHMLPLHQVLCVCLR